MHFSKNIWAWMNYEMILRGIPANIIVRNPEKIHKEISSGVPGGNPGEYSKKN